LTSSSATFLLYLNDHPPPHVRVRPADGEATFRLAPVEYRDSQGYTDRRLHRIEEIVRTHEAEFLRRWHERFDR